MASIDPYVYGSHLRSDFDLVPLYSCNRCSTHHHHPHYLTSVPDVDGEIEHLRSQIRLLSVRRNALLPIHRLPPETLLSIFSYVANSHIWSEKCSNFAYLSCVCTYWYDLTLSDPRLWTRIVNAPLRPAHAALKRSRDLPLAVIYGGQSRSSGRWTLRMPELELTSAHLHRIAHLEVVTSMNVSSLVKLWNRPKPALRSLKIHLSGLSGQRAPPLSLADAPALEEVDLERVSFSLSNPQCLGNMRKLRVQSVPVDSRMSLDEWIIAFSHMPLLEELMLSANIPLPNAEVDTAPLSTVHLSRLRVLELCDAIEVLRPLCRRLTIPSGAQINLWAYISEPDTLTADVADLACSIGDTLHRSDGRPDLASLLVFCSSAHMDISLFPLGAPVVVPRRGATPDVPPNVRLVLELQQDTYTEALASAALISFAPLLVSAAPTLSTATIETDTTTYLRSDPPTPRAGLHALLQTCPSVSTLVLRHVAADDDLSLLRDFGDDEAWHTSLLLARLKRIQCEAFLFSRARMQSLLHACQKRRLPELALMRCLGVREDDLCILRERVDRLECDAQPARIRL
jgi:hypothetical protein